MWTVLVPPVFYTAVPWVLAYGQLGVQLPDCIRNVLWQPPVKGNGTDITDDEIADFQPGATGCVYCLYRSIFLDWTYEHRGGSTNKAKIKDTRYDTKRAFFP